MAPDWQLNFWIGTYRVLGKSYKKYIYIYIYIYIHIYAFCKRYFSPPFLIVPSPLALSCCNLSLDHNITTLQAHTQKQNPPEKHRMFLFLLIDEKPINISVLISKIECSLRLAGGASLTGHDTDSVSGHLVDKNIRQKFPHFLC